MIDQVAAKVARWGILTVLLGGLLLLSYSVLQHFMVPVIWALILAYVTWPLYLRLNRWCGQRPSLAAAIMVVLIAAALIGPSTWLATLLQAEIAAAYNRLSAQLVAGSIDLPPQLQSVPLIGPWLEELIDSSLGDPAVLRQQIGEAMSFGQSAIVDLLGGVGRNTAKLGFTLITLFFIYRDGRSLLAQVHKVLHRFLGSRIDHYLAAVGGMTTAVVWGLIITAIGQGMVAGLGYWWAGVEAPVLLSAITALVAMIPFGTPFTWGSVGVWLLLSGHTVSGIGLLLWGTLVVSWVDNLVRPLVISSATRIPFLLVMFGVIGGLAAFGLVGLFLGPVILAVLVAVWREWVDEVVHDEAGNDSSANPS